MSQSPTSRQIATLIAGICVLAIGIAGAVVVRHHREAAQPVMIKASTVAGMLSIPELGIQFVLPTNDQDAFYVMDTSHQPGFADFSSHSLVTSGGATCEPGGNNLAPLGSLIVTSMPQSTSVGEGDAGYYGEPIKQLGTKYLYYRGVQSVCTDTPAAQQLQTSQLLALKQALANATLTQ